MAPRLPVVFVSHGAPDTLLRAPATVECWRQIGLRLPAPRAILVVSAHWQAARPTVSLAGRPATLHDFSGFPPALYRLCYPVPGAPDLAERVAQVLAAAGQPVARQADRGLDHGAWVPLLAMYPDADVPVTQLSLSDGDAAAHLALGRALAPLRDEGVLILASGAITHNFGWLDFRHLDAPPQPRAAAFADWVGERLAAHDAPALLDYRAAPHGAPAHPSEEHFLPLFVALGAAADDVPERLRPPFSYGGLAMDAYLWGAPSGPSTP